MSPSQSYNDLREINGPRSPSLKINKESHINGPRSPSLNINKESHIIHKPSSSMSSSLPIAAGAATSSKPPYQQRQPLIIYTHSPKIIHTKAHDFMALVQKLTGMSRSDDPTAPQHHHPEGRPASTDGHNLMIEGHDDTTSSSVNTEENYGVSDVQINSPPISAVLDPPNSYFSDIPLFTPNSSDFFCSPRPFYRYPETVFNPTNMGSSISPSILES